MLVFEQLKYIRNKDLGFDKARVIRLDLSEKEMRDKSSVLAERLKQIPIVTNVGMANASPGQGISKNLIKVEDEEGKLSDRGVDLYAADFDFIKTMAMTIVQGRDFSRDVPSDTTYAVLVNEAMVKRMAWTNPLGKKFVFDDGGTNKNPTETQVIGIVKDYHQNSLYDPIEPLLIYPSKDLNYVFVRTAEGDVKESVAAVEKAWQGDLSQ